MCNRSERGLGDGGRGASGMDPGSRASLYLCPVVAVESSREASTEGCSI